MNGTVKNSTHARQVIAVSDQAISLDFEKVLMWGWSYYKKWCLVHWFAGPDRQEMTEPCSIGSESQKGGPFSLVFAMFEERRRQQSIRLLRNMQLQGCIGSSTQ
jgi:hypothetical protein